MDLEAELAAISGGGSRRKPRKPAPVPAANLDAMIAESLKDIPSDEEVSGDDDDPDLLSELKELAIDDEAPPAPPPRATRPAPAPPGAPSAENSTVSLLQDRISNYTLAERKAKENGESSRARRFARGLRTLNDLLKQAKAGKPVNDEDIPPPVPVGKPADAPAPPPVAEPPPEASLIDLGPHEDPPSLPEPKEPPPPPPAEPELSPERQQKLDGILRRQAEFKAAALHCKRSGDKTLALEYLKTVKQFDTLVTAFKTTEEGMDFDLADLPTLETVAAAVRTPKTEEVTQKAEEPAPAPADPAPLVTASSLDEALRQRLAYFQQQEVKAKEDGNSSKARRMGRIVKQYADAVRANAAGRAIATDDLPTPPGYAPLPTEGDTQQALEYLKAAKGFDTVIEAAKGGLAVDLKSLPLPPKAKEDLEHTFDVVSAEDCGPSEDMPTVSAEDEDALSRLCNQLTSQLKLCLSNREHNRAIGNIAEANRFEHLATAVKQDLDVVAVAKSLGQSVPKFHYESRQFAVVKCNTDLNENDLELTIVRGIAYNVPNPKEVDTYVKFEFPYPQDAPVSDSTSVVKDTNSPEYNAVFPLAIHRGARACQRVFKRHAIKLNVYSRGGGCDALVCCSGWFSRDSLLGAVSVKLAPLETHATLHDAYP
ncbi:hypothetical protein O3G_MSEX015191, partial [Manduca sexta]